MTVLTAGFLLVITVFTGLIVLRRSRDEWDKNSWLVVGAGVLASASLILGKVLGAIDIQYGLYDERIISLPSWISFVEKAGLGAIVILAGILIVRHVAVEGWAVKIGRPGAWWLLAMTAGAIPPMLNGEPPVSYRWLALALLACASFVLPPSRGAALGAMAFCWILAGSTWLLFLARPDLGARICRSDKCGMLGSLLTGIFLNENALALALVIGLSFVLLLPRSMTRDIFMLSVATTTFLSGSRSALLGVAVVAAIWIVEAIRSETVAAIFRRKNEGSGLIAMIAVPLVAAADSFTGRPELWALAYELRGEEAIFGTGWASLQETFQTSAAISGASSYSLHNELIDSYYVGGIIGAAAFVAICVLLCRCWPNGCRTASWAVVAVVVWIGILERPWSFGQIDWLSWGLLGACLSNFSVPTNGMVVGVSVPHGVRRRR